MNEANGFATKDAFRKASGGQRRWKQFQCPLVGTVWLGSITAGQFARIDAARTRAALAGSGKQPDGRKQVRALNDGAVELLSAVVHDEEKNPLFDADSADDRALILGMDTCVSDSLIAACIEHCQLDETSVEEAQKK